MHLPGLRRLLPASDFLRVKYLGAALAVPVLVRHDWLVLMVIGFVAHGDFLFPDSPSELALREVDSGE